MQIPIRTPAPDRQCCCCVGVAANTKRDLQATLHLNHMRDPSPHTRTQPSHADHTLNLHPETERQTVHARICTLHPHSPWRSRPLDQTQTHVPAADRARAQRCGSSTNLKMAPNQPNLSTQGNAAMLPAVPVECYWHLAHAAPMRIPPGCQHNNKHSGMSNRCPAANNKAYSVFLQRPVASLHLPSTPPSTPLYAVAPTPNKPLSLNPHAPSTPSTFTGASTTAKTCVAIQHRNLNLLYTLHTQVRQA